MRAPSRRTYSLWDGLLSSPVEAPCPLLCPLPPRTSAIQVAKHFHPNCPFKCDLELSPNPSFSLSFPKQAPSRPRGLPHCPQAPQSRRKEEGESKGGSLGRGSDAGAEVLPGLCLGGHCHRPFTGRPITGSSGIYNLTAKDPRTHQRGNLHQAPSTPRHTSRAYCKSVT